MMTLAVVALVGVVVVAVPLRLTGRLPLHQGLRPPLAVRPAPSGARAGEGKGTSTKSTTQSPFSRFESRVHLAFPPRAPSVTAGVTATTTLAAGVAATGVLTIGVPATPSLAAGIVASPTLTAGATAPLIAGVAATITGRVGILAGHWQYDTGTVCADGRREVDVTLDVARRTKNLLEARGFEVDLLPELDPDTAGPPLQGYRAEAFISIHADSCDLPGYSGFKISRWRYSNIPTRDDRLVACLYQTYAQATGLPRHETTVSINMWNYYAFRELAAETPAAIIELGFMGDDHAVLDGKRFEMAEGVARGVACFLGR